MGSDCISSRSLLIFLLYIKVSSNKDSPSYIVLKYRYFWLKFIATIRSALLVCPLCCLLTRVLWHRNRHCSRKNTSLATLLSGDVSKACADLTTSLGAAILERTPPFYARLLARHRRDFTFDTGWEGRHHWRRKWYTWESQTKTVK